MWNARLCLGLSKQFGDDYQKQLELFKETGFDGFFGEWSGSLDIMGLKQKGDELGMIFQSVHAPFVKSQFMWKNGEEAKEAKDELLRCLKDCKKADVPIMVCHAFIGFEDHSPNEYGVENYGVIVKEAEKLGIKIAFENTEGEEYLAKLMEAFDDCGHVGFCWDTGHEMCYNHSKDMTALYGDRLFCTHLNDNLGIKDYSGEITYIDDLHLLPFDGIADWNDITARLNKCGYNDILTFELNTISKPGRHENDKYARMPIEEYIAEVFVRACRVAELKRKNPMK